MAPCRAGQEQEREAPGAGGQGRAEGRADGMRGGGDVTDTRRGGGERRGAGAQGGAGTRLKVEGDVVMADADENPKRRARGQRRGRGEMGRQSMGAQASAEGTTRQRDARRIVGTASSVGQNEKQTGCSVGMWYSDGAERKIVTDENGRRWRGAALCPSGTARCQGCNL